VNAKPAPEHEALTGGKPLSSPESAGKLGQAYAGPVVLLIDGFTYSAADIFAGGFADHRIGTIVGIGKTTAGGGASVWTHEELVSKLSSVVDLIPVKSLPASVKMRVAALRSLRVRRNLRVPIEDIGVAADLVYTPDLADVVGRFCNLFRFVCGEVLSKTKVEFRVDILKAEIVSGGISVKVRTVGVRRLIFAINDREVLCLRADPGTDVSIVVPASLPPSGRVVVLVRGRMPQVWRPVAATGKVIREAPLAAVQTRA